MDEERYEQVRRFLGLDFGEKNIGVAVSDPFGWTAQGLKTIQRKDRSADKEELKKIINTYQIGAVVIGLPKDIKGEEGPQAKRVKRWAEGIKKALNLEVIFWDERLTTREAEKVLIEADLSRKQRKKVIDKTAATLILQGYLDYRRREPRINTNKHK